MDHMSFISILTVTVPELILNIFFGFLVIGAENKLNLKSKSNLISLFLAVGLMACATYLIRSTVAIGILSMLGMLISFTIILKIIYNIRWLKSFVSVTIFILLLMVSEIVALTPIVAFITNSYSGILSSDMTRFLCSLPTRVIQIYAVYTLWKTQIVLVNAKKFESIKKIALTMFTTFSIGIFGLIMVFSYNIEKFSMPIRIIYIVSLCFIEFGVVLGFKLVTVTTKKLRLSQLDVTESNNMIDAAIKLMSRGKTEEAKDVLNKSKKAS